MKDESVLTRSVCFALQDSQEVFTSLYTMKWFFQCFLDRVSGPGGRVPSGVGRLTFDLVRVRVQTPFTLTLRIWDIYILEGERVLPAMSYTILKLHRSESHSQAAGGRRQEAAADLRGLTARACVCVCYQSTC